MLTTLHTTPDRSRTIDGRYRLVSVLGRGRFGVVHEAVEQRTGRRVAIRLTHPDLVGDTRAFAERFFAEGARRVRLAHSHTLRVHDYGRTSDDTFFMVMELVRGRALSQLLSARGSVDATLAAQMCERVCASLAEAHRHGVIHGQLSPDLVWLTGRGLSGLKVVGYGDTTLRGRAQLAVWEARHVRYAAPERLAGEPLTQASDVYGVGLLLFELLTGRAAYTDDSAVRVLLAQRQGTVTRGPWFDKLRAMTPALANIIACCLAAAPSERYANITVLERALARHHLEIAA